MINGWIILDKPSGITSAHAVAKVKRLLKPSKIGHAGTLDPLASGVLPLALGEATKTVAFMMDAGKSYGFEVTWGEERDSDDITGQPTAQSAKRPPEDEIRAILPEFTGSIHQQPPSYSAIKVEGKRAYALARSGQDVELKPREVLVNALELISYSTDKSEFICHCGKGVYIRSLARDMGRKLGCFGHISRLRRLRVGKFAEKDAISLEVLEKMMHNSGLGFVLPVESALDDIPAMEVDFSQAMKLKSGQAIYLPGDSSPMEEGAGISVLARHHGKAVAICYALRGKVRPVRVFNMI